MKNDDEFWGPIKSVGLLFVVTGTLLVNIVTAIFSLAGEGVFSLQSGARKRADERERKAEEEKIRPTPIDVAALVRTIEIRVAAANFPDKSKLAETLVDRFGDYKLSQYADKMPAPAICRAFFELAWQLLQAEIPIIPTLSRDQIELAKQTDYLLAQAKKFENGKAMLDAFYEAITLAFVLFSNNLPLIALTTPGETVSGIGTVQLLDVLPNVRTAMSDLIACLFVTAAKELNLFRIMADDIKEKDRNGLPDPDKFKGTDLELVNAYLGGTPLRALFDVQIPFSISREARLEHWHLMAPTGWGKTQTLQHIIYHDLTAPDPPALVVVEPKGDMIAALSKLQIFANTPERIAIIDPAYNPQLNMFAVRSRTGRYDQDARNQIEASVIQLYGYVFGALDTDISTNQSAALAYVCKLVLSQERGTMRDFLKVLNDPAKKLEDSEFEHPIRKLGEYAVEFFRSQFFAGTFPISRRALASKIFSLLSKSPAFEQMFTAKENRLDMFERIQMPGSITLVNTSLNTIKREASSILGRFMIAQTMAAAFERAPIPEANRRPAYLIIDEAGSYFDDSIEDILVQARSMGLGIFFAHQFLAQLKGASLRSSVLGMPAIKFAAPTEEDLPTMAANMKANPPDLLRSLKHTKRTGTQYGVFVRGEISNALRVYVPFGTVENAPQMSGKEHAALIAKNRERFSGDTTTRKLEVKPVETLPEGDHEF